MLKPVELLNFFFNITNVFTVNFNQLNTYLLKEKLQFIYFKW